MKWLQDLHWSLYYESGWRWLSKPEPREWNVLLIDGMEPPLPRPGYEQRIVRLPSDMAALQNMNTDRLRYLLDGVQTGVRNPFTEHLMR